MGKLSHGVRNSPYATLQRQSHEYVAHVREQRHNSKNGEFQLWYPWYCLFFFLVHAEVKTIKFYLQNWPLEGRTVCVTVVLHQAKYEQ